MTTLARQNQDQPSVDVAIDLVSAYSRAFDRCPQEMAIVHDFIIEQLNKIPRPESNDYNERLWLRFSEIRPLAMQDSTISSALEKIDLEVNRILNLSKIQATGSNETNFVLPAIAAGEFIIVFATTYAVWCAADPSGC
jgi:hypothetical protein